MKAESMRVRMGHLSKAFDRRISKMISEAYCVLPFYWLNVVRRSVGEGTRNVLDVGCGSGEPMAYIKKTRSLYAVGIDGYLAGLSQCRHSGVHDKVVLADVKRLPIREKSFDTVICLDVLEYLEKPEGSELITALEAIARREVIISSPVSAGTSHTASPNPLVREYRSEWQVDEMKSRGYHVHGNRPRFTVGETKLKSSKLLAMLKFMDLFPVFYFLPGIAGHMVCVKQISE